MTTLANASRPAPRHRETRAAEDDGGVPPQPSDEPYEIPRCQRQAALRGGPVCPRAMNEDCTTAAPYAWNPVMREDDHDVVQVVTAPKRFRRRGIGAANPSVVVAIASGIAPAVVKPDRARGQLRKGRELSVATVEECDGPIPPERCRAISFALQCTDAGTADHAAQDAGPDA